MHLEDGSVRNIIELCEYMGSQNKKLLKVSIPYYQRPYKWEKEQIDNLITDFDKNEKENSNSEEEGAKNEYFVGLVVLVKNARGTGRYDIIDGQQRITTIFLLNYLKYIILKAYIEELLSIKRTSIEGLLTNLEDCYANLLGTQKNAQFKRVKELIVEKLDTINDVSEDEREKIYCEIIKTYEDTVGLPKKDFSNENEYKKQYVQTLEKFFAGEELALQYCRESYNHKLVSALTKVGIFVSKDHKPKLFVAEEEKDEVVLQYINAIKYEYDAILGILDIEHETPLNVTKKIIEVIDKMIANIKFCVIVTGNEKDAYTLFEVLNDRALAIDDLELIKNLFLKEYCNKSGDTDSEIDKNIENLDKIWVEEIFTQNVNISNIKRISYLGTIYLTADESVYTKKTERYREIIEKSYLNIEYEKGNKPYRYLNVLNDIKIYQMIKVIIDKFKLPVNNAIDESISAECNLKKSITYKTFHLLNAVKYDGVLPALTNLIIKEYMDNNCQSEKEADIDDFEKYVSRIADDWEHREKEFEVIHKWSFVLWKAAILSKDYSIPREIARKIIAKVYRREKNLDGIVIDAQLQAKMNKEFDEWTTEWQYGKKNSDFKIKVLFIHLFETDNHKGKLNLNSSVHAFVTKKLELDHMEANKQDPNSREKYFEPQDLNDDRKRYVNGLGNFMVLDSDDNNNKGNKPLYDAIDYYDNMSKNHWLVCEVREMLNNDAYSKKITIVNNVYRVPTEMFFIERRKRLQKYFKAILNRELEEREMVID